MTDRKDRKLIRAVAGCVNVVRGDFAEHNSAQAGGVGQQNNPIQWEGGPGAHVFSSSHTCHFCFRCGCLATALEINKAHFLATIYWRSQHVHNLDSRAGELGKKSTPSLGSVQRKFGSQISMTRIAFGKGWERYIGIRVR